MKPIQEVEAILRAAIEARRAKGIRIARDRFGFEVDYKNELLDASYLGCCAIGAWVLETRPAPPWPPDGPGIVADEDVYASHATCLAFGWNDDQFWAFIYSFDGGGMGKASAERHPDIADLGRRLADEYAIPIQPEAA